MSYLDELKNTYRKLGEEKKRTAPGTRQYRKIISRMDAIRGEARVAQRVDEAMREKRV